LALRLAQVAVSCVPNEHREQIRPESKMLSFSDLWVICRLSAKLIGIGPIFLSMIMMGAGTGIIVFTLPADTRLGFYVYLLEAGAPLLIALSLAFIVAPEADPAIELLMSYRRSLAWARIARLVTFTVEIGTVLLLSNAAFVEWNARQLSLGFWQLIITWLSPAIFLSGIGMTSTLWFRRGAAGVAAAFTAYAANMLFLLVQMLFRSPPLFQSSLFRSIYLFLTALTLQTPLDTMWLVNRLVLLILGCAVAVLGLWLVRDDERTLGVAAISHSAKVHAVLEADFRWRNVNSR
jgi:hypothetical protein